MQLIEPRSGARGIRAIGPSRTRCTRRSKRPSPAVAGPMRHIDFETEPRLERIFAQMRTRGARRCARRLAGRARPEAHRFHGGADYFIASRTTLVAGALLGGLTWRRLLRSLEENPAIDCWSGGSAAGRS
jgi:hypothetical protein